MALLVSAATGYGTEKFWWVVAWCDEVVGARGGRVMGWLVDGDGCTVWDELS